MPDLEFKAFLTGLTADGAPDTAADYVITYDASADALKKALLEDLGAGGGLSGLGGTDNAIVRTNGTGGNAAQGSLMTIDDNGAPTIPDQQNYWISNKAMIGYNSAGPVVNINALKVATVQTFFGTEAKFVDSGDVTVFKVDSSVTAGQTRMLVYDVDNATLERVTVGAADSGGSGFKVLRIPN